VVSAPASIDLEFRGAAVVHPYSGAIGAEVAPLDTRAVGNLPGDRYAPRSTQVDGTEVVLEVPALAGHVEARVPIRPGIPAVLVTIVMAITVVATIGVIALVPVGVDEPSRTAPIDPQATAIEIPVLAADAMRLGQLVDQARIAPGNRATRPVHVVAPAFHGLAARVFLRVDSWGRRSEKQRHCSQSRNTVDHEKFSRTKTSGAGRAARDAT